MVVFTSSFSIGPFPAGVFMVGKAQRAKLTGGGEVELSISDKLAPF